MNISEIAIAADHAGFACKEAIRKHLEGKKIYVEDFGTHSEESVDYPDFAHPLAAAVDNGRFSMGIVCCGSGNGVCMTVNKHAGIRGALCWNAEITSLARQHNDANVLCIPARFLTTDEVLKMVDIFLSTEFEGGRHERRTEKI